MFVSRKVRTRSMRKRAAYQRRLRDKALQELVPVLRRDWRERVSLAVERVLEYNDE